MPSSSEIVVLNDDGSIEGILKRLDAMVEFLESKSIASNTPSYGRDLLLSLMNANNAVKESQKLASEVRACHASHQSKSDQLEKTQSSLDSRSQDLDLKEASIKEIEASIRSRERKLDEATRLIQQQEEVSKKLKENLNEREKGLQVREDEATSMKALEGITQSRARDVQERCETIARKEDVLRERERMLGE